MAATTFLTEYFSKLYLRLDPKNKGKDFNDLLQDAITLGIRDFVASVPWAFRQKTDTVTTTVSSKTVEMPTDLDGLISITEHTTNNGRKLVKYGEDEFDRIIPDSESMNTGTPGIFKIYYNFEDGLWKIDVYPTPDAAISLYVSYIAMVDDSPEKFYPGIVAAVGKYMNPPGSKERAECMVEMTAEVERLRAVDNVDVSPISRVRDSSDEPLAWDFEEYMRVRRG
jgi:hypothetical protein